MWDGLFMLLALSAIMGVASFLAGILPLSFTLAPRQIRTISLLGTGVLVGASLIVIIPEGIETMYSAAIKSHAHNVPNPQPKIPSQQKGTLNPNEFIPDKVRTEALNVADFSKTGVNKAPDAASIIVRRTPDTPAVDSYKQRGKNQEQKASAEEEHATTQKGDDDDSTEGHKEGHSRVHGPEEDQQEAVKVDTDIEGPHGYIGVALILGFILMFLVDHLPEALSASQKEYQSLHISLSNLHRGPHNSSSMSLNTLNVETPEPLTPLPPHVSKPPRSSATTIGLVIHSCADGIALGASSSAPSTSLSLVIFLAIMLHKAPAAFGMTSVLLKQGFSKRRIQKHLAIFSMAAPAGAVLTWSIVHLLGRNRLGGDDGLAWTTGWVLLFSGGTFLYVAMHSMTEATTSEEQPVINGYINHHTSHSSGLSKSDIAFVLTGMLVPLLTQVGHHH
ncbi:ZIP metal ion transporter-like protein [Bimuria novae-zelandiae CBS 107.79]|uniref:ZIP metal ion transporter-like protein n=1 Tax=Bimuria novae-zelandiae CBS 107.79 TaxID=1447943 RepID=A0A6A5UVF3_9PLEO|nr:ZIP metal ion transporter-like protein [Bimuria novae-zelandiae CBS 107.79]